MSAHSHPHTARFAHDLRANPTPAEIRLWSVLRKHVGSYSYLTKEHIIED